MTAHRWITPLLALAVLGCAASCARRMPELDLGRLDPTFMKLCTDGPGVLVVRDERYEDIWGGGYDKTKWLLLGEDRGQDVLGAPTTSMALRRRLLKVLSPIGAKAASTFEVVHYREDLPPYEVRVWMADGTPRPVRVHPVETLPLAEWGCEFSYPRRTTFRIATLEAGDVVEILHPLCGPDQLEWNFGSSSFCVASSSCQLGHPDDTYRLDLHAFILDASGGVQRSSAAGAYPMRFELTKALPPLSADRVPRLRFAQRCPGWSHLRGRIFQTALWLARHDAIQGRRLVNPHLASPVAAGERARRIRTVADWLQRAVKIEEWAGPGWMRWMPRQTAHQTAKRRAGDAGSQSVLAFRILEDAGLAPRFALVHTHPRNPFLTEQVDVSQFDALAVLVEDDEGRSHWLVPGLAYKPEEQPPASLRGRQALVLERWWIERQTGGGRCRPEIELPWSCQLQTPEPVELKLVEIR
ncbi:MAG: hypothetical protein JXR96_24455 [Deltaproteobacteria bacterium]|nr:hypothetical protein [Deltaproteobacteria bacterium]